MTGHASTSRVRGAVVFVALTMILASEATAAIIRNVWWGYLLAIPLMGSTAAFGSIVFRDLWYGRDA